MDDAIILISRLRNCQTGRHFQEKPCDQVVDIIDQFYLSRGVPSLSLIFTRCQAVENLKEASFLFSEIWKKRSCVFWKV